MQLISRQPLGSDTTPIAYYTAREVRSVLRVVASQGKTTGLKKKKSKSAVAVIFAPKSAIVRTPKLSATGGEIFGQYSRVRFFYGRRTTLTTVDHTLLR